MRTTPRLQHGSRVQGLDFLGAECTKFLTSSSSWGSSFTADAGTSKAASPAAAGPPGGPGLEPLASLESLELEVELELLEGLAAPGPAQSFSSSLPPRMSIIDKIPSSCRSSESESSEPFLDFAALQALPAPGCSSEARFIPSPD